MCFSRPVDEHSSYLFLQVKGVKNEMASIRSSMQQVKDLQTKIITEVSQQKSKGGAQSMHTAPYVHGV